MKLANSPVFKEDGEVIRLGQLWKNQKTVMVFLRHFACIACRAHAQQVWEQRETYKNTGAAVVFIGNGQPHFISKFKEDLNIQEATVITDPSLETFRAAGFRKGFQYIIHPRSAFNVAKLAAQGHRQTKSSEGTGTHWQLGGVLVVKTDGKVLFHFISETIGDFPESEEVIKYEKAT